MNNKAIHTQWKKWIGEKRHFSPKLHKTYLRLSDRFSTTHAVSEAGLRRLIFIGLRIKEVKYKSAKSWLENNHMTYGPNNKRGHNFVYCFDKLYEPDWAQLMKSQGGLTELWGLWQDYAKPIRNHLFHAQRKYSNEWLDTGLAVNQLFLMRLDKAMTRIVGGSPFAHLKHLSPRLKWGDSAVRPGKVLNLNPKKVYPKMSLSTARAVLGAI